MNVKILLVDDHEMVRDGLRLLIEREAGFEIVGEASNPEEAMAKMQQMDGGIVVMDVHLEGGNGVELSAQISSRWPRARILILTAFADKTVVESALKAGAKGFLVKFSAGREFINALRALAADRAYFCPQASAAIVKNYNQPIQSVSQPEVTPREREVWKLTSEGLRVKDIANHLNIGVKTVETHRANLMRKLHCNGTADLTRRAIRAGISPL